MRFTAISLFVIAMVLVAQAANPGAIRKNMKGGPILASDEVGADTWKDLIDSFIDGTDIDTIIRHTSDCVHNVEFSWQDTNEAIGHFIQRGWTWENWLDLTDSIGTFTPLIRNCYNVTLDADSDFIQYINAFDSLVDFGLQAKDNVLRHIFDWYDIINKFNTAFAAKKNKEVAYQAGRGVSLFFVFTPRMDTPRGLPVTLGDLPDFRWLEEIFKGFINGTQVFSSKNVKNCVNQTEFIVKSIEDANVQFRKKTPDGNREGAFELADICAVIKPLNVDCYTGYGDIQAVIQKYIKTFSSPLDIAFNAAKHFNQIYVDILSIVQHYDHSEWFKLGHDFGEIFFYIFFDH